MTAVKTEVELRELDGVAELKRAEDFQRAVWGADDPADNSDLMLAIQHEGGLVAGAFVEASVPWSSGLRYRRAAGEVGR